MELIEIEKSFLIIEFVPLRSVSNYNFYFIWHFFLYQIYGLFDDFFKIYGFMRLESHIASDYDFGISIFYSGR